MYCRKHPHQKMTLLFSFYVCDECEPPKGAPQKEEKKRFIYSTEFFVALGFPEDQLRASGSKIDILMSGTVQDDRMADIILTFFSGDPNRTVEILKHRWWSTYPIQTFAQEAFDMLHNIATMSSANGRRKVCLRMAVP